jgi:hypothetical protein
MAEFKQLPPHGRLQYIEAATAQLEQGGTLFKPAADGDTKNKRQTKFPESST